MIQELDQEKQEAAERWGIEDSNKTIFKVFFNLYLLIYIHNTFSPWRSERINQQYRDDVVNRVRTELMLEHNTQVKQLTAQHQQEVQQLQ